MKEIPLLCSTPVVQSMLEGRKGQTRRIINPQAMVNEKGQLVWDNAPKSKTRQIEKGLPMSYGLKDHCPYQTGDLLYVRETWGVGCRPDPFQGSVDGIEFKADGKYIDEIESLPLHFYDDFDYGNYDKQGWRPSIHMPKSIARIWLQVIDVRVERLQDISEEDAIAEGIVKIDYGIQTPHGSASLDGGKTFHPFKPQQVFGYSENPASPQDQSLRTARTAFGNLWESINGADSWNANPWVWCLSFIVLSSTGKPDLNNQ